MKAVVRKIKNKYDVSVEYKDKLTDKRRFKRIGLYENRDLALFERDKLEQDIIDGEYTFDNLKPKVESLNTYIKYSLEKEFKRGLEDSTYNSYNKIFNTHIVEFGDIIIDRLNSELLQNFIDSKAKDYSKSTVNIIFSVIKKGINEAMLRDIIDKDISKPVKIWGRAEKSSAKTNYLPLEDLQILIDKSKGTELGLQILLAVTLGLRISEVLGLKWDMIDLENNTICIENISSVNLKGENIIKDTTKNGEIVCLEIPRILKNELINYKKICDNRVTCVDNLLFIHNNKPVNVSSLSNKFKRFAKGLGYDITFHGLRHSCSTLLFENGYSIEKISKVLNHKSKTTTDKVYIHLTKSIRKEASNTINSIFI